MSTRRFIAGSTARAGRGFAAWRDGAPGRSGGPGHPPRRRWPAGPRALGRLARIGSATVRGCVFAAVGSGCAKGGGLARDGRAAAPPFGAQPARHRGLHPFTGVADHPRLLAQAAPAPVTPDPAPDGCALARAPRAGRARRPGVLVDARRQGDRRRDGERPARHRSGAGPERPPGEPADRRRRSPDGTLRSRSAGSGRPRRVHQPTREGTAGSWACPPHPRAPG